MGLTVKVRNVGLKVRDALVAGRVKRDTVPAGTLFRDTAAGGPAVDYLERIRSLRRRAEGSSADQADLAEEILLLVPNGAEEAAIRQEQEVIVIPDLNAERDFVRTVDLTEPSPELLIELIEGRVAQLVFKRLLDERLRPTIENGRKHNGKYGDFYIAIPTNQSKFQGDAQAATALPDKEDCLE